MEKDSGRAPPGPSAALPNEAVLWESKGLRVVSLASDQARAGRWTPPYRSWATGIVLVRHGAFRRRSDGNEHFVDASMGFFRRAGVESSVRHCTEGLHAVTMIDLSDCTIPTLGVDEWPAASFVVPPELDLAHRLLLHGIAAGTYSVRVDREVRALLAGALKQRPDRRRRRSHAETRRQLLVCDACEIIHSSLDTRLNELARALRSSPSHLSRAFKEHTGLTLRQYRLRLRLHEALNMLTDGVDDLAEIARRAGFSDHSHMARTFVTQLGETPSSLRSMLGPGPLPQAMPG